MELTDLAPRLAGGGTAVVTETGWRLTIPSGDDRAYRLAQVDDHSDRVRRSLQWQPGAALQLRARASAVDMSGTWGFGFWNNPFGLACGPTRESRRLPALPQSAWFFSASARSYLSLRDDCPGNGFFAQVYQSGRTGPWLLPTALAFPFSPTAARRRLRLRIQDESISIPVDTREWHTYRLEWNETSTIFAVDGRLIMRTGLSPVSPLGLIMWIDNQFAGFDPHGKMTWGTESSPSESCLEIEDLTVTEPTGNL